MTWRTGPTEAPRWVRTRGGARLLRVDTIIAIRREAVGGAGQQMVKLVTDPPNFGGDLAFMLCDDQEHAELVATSLAQAIATGTAPIISAEDQEQGT